MTLLVLILTAILLYYIFLYKETDFTKMRPARTCPRCKAAVGPKDSVCPVCKETLQKRCSICGETIGASWKYCPYCESPLTTSDGK